VDLRLHFETLAASTLEGGSFPMRWLRRVVCRRAALATGLVLLASVACRTENGPEPVVERFLRAFNDKDLNVMLTSIDPRQERMFRASFRLVEKFSGGRLPVEDLLELVPGLYQIFQNRLSADFSLRDFQVYRATTNGEQADVPVILTASTRSGGVQKDERQRLHFVLRQFEEGWRIVGLQQK
jgi:hypothetical protein